MDQDACTQGNGAEAIADHQHANNYYDGQQAGEILNHGGLAALFQNEVRADVQLNIGMASPNVIPELRDRGCDFHALVNIGITGIQGQVSKGETGVLGQ